MSITSEIGKIASGNALARRDRNRVRRSGLTHRPHTGAQSEVRRKAGQERVKAAIGAGAAPKVLRVPITNTFDYSDYSAVIAVGSERNTVNVILDTGSSSLGCDPSVYSGQGDSNLSPTTFVQIVTYGTGGWAGPVVNTTVNLGGLTLDGCPVAIADVQEKGNFQGVTGILGLAYYLLNDDYDFKKYLISKNAEASYPWTLGTGSWQTEYTKLQSIVQNESLPPGTLTPYFDQLERQGVVANKFAFNVKRSWVSLGSADWKTDPINQGVFVIGGGQEQTDLYQAGSTFLNVAVLADVYYNTNLKSVWVGSQQPVVAAPLQAQYRDQSYSISIIDSGTSDLSLAKDVYEAVLAGLGQTNPEFLKLVQAAQKSFAEEGNGIPSSSLNLAAWPIVYFTFTGVSGDDVELAVAPATYWQVDFPKKGEAVFQISGPLDSINQSILGLPLLNNYYTVFDRSLDSKGVVSFAPIA
jgi:hypothetical protein